MGKYTMLNVPNQEDIECGQAIYTKKTLPLYDMIVTQLSNRFVWCCPKELLIDFFKENITNNHLDIGVGTGYFLRNINLKSNQQRLGLLDKNKDCLDYVQRRLGKFHPEVYQHDIFEPFLNISEKFSSVSINYVLHCLPGKLSQKSVIFDNIKSIMTSGGKFFGSTILGKDTNRNWMAEKLLSFYNEKKIMSNLSDDSKTLLEELQKRFSNVQIIEKGCVALFVAV